jgi:hypothetical protein
MLPWMLDRPGLVAPGDRLVLFADGAAVDPACASTLSAVPRSRPIAASRTIAGRLIIAVFTPKMRCLFSTFRRF